MKRVIYPRYQSIFRDSSYHNNFLDYYLGNIFSYFIFLIIYTQFVNNKVIDKIDNKRMGLFMLGFMIVFVTSIIYYLFNCIYFIISSKINDNCGCPEFTNIKKDKSYISRKIASYTQYKQEINNLEDVENINKNLCYRPWNKEKNLKLYESLNDEEKAIINKIIDDNSDLNTNSNYSDNLNKLIKNLDKAHCYKKGKLCTTDEINKFKIPVKNPNSVSLYFTFILGIILPVGIFSSCLYNGYNSFSSNSNYSPNSNKNTYINSNINSNITYSNQNSKMSGNINGNNMRGNNKTVGGKKKKLTYFKFK